jgi:hypothetical protein
MAVERYLVLPLSPGNDFLAVIFTSLPILPVALTLQSWSNTSPPSQPSQPTIPLNQASQASYWGNLLNPLGSCWLTLFGGVFGDNPDAGRSRGVKGRKHLLVGSGGRPGRNRVGQQPLLGSRPKNRKQVGPRRRRHQINLVGQPS